MLKKIALVAFTLVAAACTLHPPANKQVACEQAQRQNTFNTTVIAPQMSQTKQLQTTTKDIAENC